MNTSTKNGTTVTARAQEVFSTFLDLSVIVGALCNIFSCKNSLFCKEKKTQTSVLLIMSFDAFTVSDKVTVKLFLAESGLHVSSYSPKDIDHSPTLGCSM